MTRAAPWVPTRESGWTHVCIDWKVELSTIQRVAEDLLKIGELAKSAGVPIATVKFYIREGLIRPVRKTGRTMSWYAPGCVAKVRAIKALQQEQFLPLDVIRESLAGDAAASDDLTAAAAIGKVLERHTGPK